MKMKTRSPWGTMSERGTMKFIDDDTMEYDFTSSVFFGLIKVAEFEGTSKRKR